MAPLLDEVLSDDVKERLTSLAEGMSYLAAKISDSSGQLRNLQRLDFRQPGCTLSFEIDVDCWGPEQWNVLIAVSVTCASFLKKRKHSSLHGNLLPLYINMVQHSFSLILLAMGLILNAAESVFFPCWNARKTFLNSNFTLVCLIRNLETGLELWGQYYTHIWRIFAVFFGLKKLNLSSDDRRLLTAVV